MNNEEHLTNEFEVQYISTRTGNKLPPAAVKAYLARVARENNDNNVEEEVNNNEELTSSTTSNEENVVLENNEVEVNEQEVITPVEQEVILETIDEVQEVEEPKKKKKKREKWKVWDIISTVLICLFTVFVVYQLVLKFTNYTPNLFGYRTDVVLTDSMSVKNERHEEFLKDHDNQLQPHDLVVSKLIDDKTEIKVYDIVIFDSPIFGETIHRVVNIVEDQGVIKYQIRGDKAATADGWFLRSDIIAKMEFSIPKIGVVFSYLQSFYGLITVIGIIFILSIFTYLYDLPEKEKVQKRIIRYLVYVKKPNDPNIEPTRIVIKKESLKKYIKKIR